MADRTLSGQHFLPLFSETFPHAAVHRLEGVGLYSLEDAPEAICTHVASFLEHI